jgi:hypothetical protein
MHTEIIVYRTIHSAHAALTEDLYDPVASFKNGVALEGHLMANSIDIFVPQHGSI